MSERRHTGSIYLLFLFSGFTGLVYEVLWTRMFALVFGVTTFAISTVLATFMAGLALGSFCFGRFVDKRGDPIKIYAYLEILIGIYALILPFLISGMTGIYVILHQRFSPSFVTTSIIRFFMSFMLLIIPTTLMGGTLPVLSKFVVSRRENLGLSIGGLYSINTIGGSVGCFAAGFILIALAGVRNTIYIAAGINLAIGAVALMIRSRDHEGPQVYSREGPSEERLDKAQLRRIYLMIAAFGLSGFAALAYEVLWTRVLSMILGTTVYAFSIMLTSFLCGLALGSFIIGRFVDRIKRPVLVFGAFQIAIGGLGVFSIFIMGKMPLLFLKMLQRFGESWQDFTFVQFAMAFLVMLIPTSLMGAAFPLVSRICAPQMENLGRRIGSIYSANTVGSICGSLVAGFLLIPVIGLENSIVFAACINILTGLVVLISSGSWDFGASRANQIEAIVSVFLLFLALAVIPSWDKRVLASGVYFEPQQYRNRANQIDLDGRMNESQMLYYGEGLGSTVAVFQRGPERTLMINGKPVASTIRTDVGLLGMMGHLPVILHKNPKNVLVIGLGAGVTAGMVAQHGSVTRIDCVELEQKVVDATEHFKLENRDVLNDAKLNLTIDDGRNFLLTTTSRYDVITSDPIHPWVSGAGSLYSIEHFQQCRARLKDGGIIAQWLPLYEMPEQDFRMIIKTFQSVFPHTALWLTDSDSILIGTKDELRIDYSSLTRKLRDEKIQKDMRMMYVDSVFDFLTCFVLGADDLSEYTADAKLNTDDYPILEFSAPKGLHSQTVADNLEAIMQRMKPAIPFLHNIGYEDQASEIKQELLVYHERKKQDLKRQILDLRSH